MKTIFRLIILGLLLTMLGGFAYAFYLIGAFDSILQSSPQATSVVQQFNPEITQIPETAFPITPDTHPNAPIFRDLLNDVNALRHRHGMGTLRINSQLNAAAATQAHYNALIYNPTHDDANGNQVDVRVEAQGYLWSTVAENLLSNWDIDGHSVFSSWEGSPTHYDNLVNPRVTEIGMAYVVTPIGQVYHAMVLAQPR